MGRPRKRPSRMMRVYDEDALLFKRLAKLHNRPQPEIISLALGQEEVMRHLKKAFKIDSKNI